MNQSVPIPVQLPVLADVQRYMDELSIMDAPEPTATKGLIMEQLPEIRDSLVSSSNYDLLAQKILSIVKPAREDEDMKVRDKSPFFRQQIYAPLSSFY